MFGEDDVSVGLIANGLHFCAHRLRFLMQSLYDLLLGHQERLEGSNFVWQNARQHERFGSLFKHLLHRRTRCFRGFK